MDALEPNDAKRRVLWPIKNEAAAVTAEMRQNAKWAASRSTVRYTNARLAEGHCQKLRLSNGRSSRTMANFSLARFRFLKYRFHARSKHMDATCSHKLLCCAGQLLAGSKLESAPQSPATPSTSPQHDAYAPALTFLYKPLRSYCVSLI